MKPAFSACILVLLVSSAAFSQPPAPKFEFPAGSDYVEVSFTIASNKIYFPIKINGFLSTQVVLDTGNPGILFTTEMVTRLKLTEAGHFPLGGLGTKPMLAKYFNETISVDLGGLIISNLAPISTNIDSLLAPYEGRHMYGGLGGALLSNSALEIDYALKKIRIYAPGKFNPANDGEVISLDLSSGHPVAQGTIYIKGKGYPVRLTMDTGVRLPALIHGYFLLQNNLEPSAFGKSFKALVGAGFGGEVRHNVARVDRLEIGGVRIENPWITFGDKPAKMPEHSFDDGIVGFPILSQFILVYDYPASKLYLRQTDKKPGPLTYDRAGMFLVAYGPDLKGVKVGDVVAGSPAEKAGMQTGDQILRVNSKTVEEFNSLDDIRAVFKMPAGSKIAVTLLRGGKQTQVSVVLTNLI